MRPGSSSCRARVALAAGRRVTAAPTMARALAVPLALAAVGTQALQILDARDGLAIEAVASIKEPTRIRIDGAAITDVFGNIHSSGCTALAAPAAAAMANSAGVSPGIGAAISPATSPVINPAGEFDLECDRDKGEIYIRPVGESTKPVNLFISSAGATYTLVLRRSDKPADTIVIRDRSARPTAVTTTASCAPGTGPCAPAPNHVRAMKAMLVAMASQRVPADIRIDELNRPMQLWAEARLLLTRRFEGRGLVGETYLLRNIGTEDMVLAEQEFDRPDDADGEGAGPVLGVAIEHHNLRPGESTAVFVVRRGAER